MKITENIKNILEQGQFKENIYILPDVTLDRKDYQEVNKVLISLGGKWKTRVGHIFNGTQEELEGALFEVLEKGETITLDEIKKQFQYFPTPQVLAEKLVELADIQKTDNVLEPSAGQGSIVDEILKKDFLNLNLVELNSDNYLVLGKKYEGQYNILISNCDFLDFRDNGMLEGYTGDKKELQFNKIVANPPFSKNQDVKHILHMYELLEEGGRIVSIASSMIQHKQTKLHDELRALSPEFIEVEEGAFEESGTMVRTCIVIINK